jgi:segregation and condensation protein B
MDFERILESILFAAGDPYPISRLADLFGLTEAEVSEIADRLGDSLRFENRGVCLIRLENSLQLCSDPANAEYVRRALDTRRPSRLSPAALEVLAITAYFQPVTRSYVEQMRGVDSSYTMGLLADKGFIEPCGKLDAPGRPMQYRTTALFLRTFGLSALSELPAQGVDAIRDKLTQTEGQLSFSDMSETEEA